MASYGGAVALLDSDDFSLGNDTASNFTGNLAVQGGALYVKSENAKFAGCEVRLLLLENAAAH